MFDELIVQVLTCTWRMRIDVPDFEYPLPALFFGTRDELEAAITRMRKEGGSIWATPWAYGPDPAVDHLQILLDLDDNPSETTSA